MTTGFRSGFVALAGRPNVGKSTLLNALVGEKVAIVSARPQTTRRRVLGIHTNDDAQAVFVDTPGLHAPRHALGRYMVRVARRAIGDADVALFVVDISCPPAPDDAGVAEVLRRSGRPVVLVLNKHDLVAGVDPPPAAEAYQALVSHERWLYTTATTGWNLDVLWRIVVDLLPEGPAFYPPDQITDQTERVLAAEMVREAALRHLREEVPHGIEVAIDEWTARASGTTYIAARLIVERESHKPIAIGRRGSMLKRIGSEARRDIEDMLGTPVYLELTVCVRPDWRSSGSELRRMGFDTRA